MCGICGIFDPDKISDSSISSLIRMRDRLRLRGPDDEGLYRDESVALGIRRLSVIDLKTGRQPIANEDDSVWVVLNGEIYNYRELRRDLEQKGHRFRTQSDTEVLVHLYEESGERLVESLRGMFAFALWDKRKKMLMLARDRFGIKPLYYAQQGSRLIFSSELRSLLQHPEISRETDPDAVDLYLTTGYIPSPLSIIRGIQKVPPATVLTATAQKIELKKYWAPSLPQPDLKLDIPELQQQLSRHLADSVALHLRSDVPVGVLLSGGLDSSLILSEVVKASQKQVTAFTIGFEEASFDETAAAAQIARHFGVDHQIETIGTREQLDRIPEILGACDEPLADSSVIPTWFLSRLAKRSVTVALSGDGGDELFGGYPTYAAHRIAQRLGILPQPFWAAAQWAANRLPVSDKNFSFDFIAGQFLRGAGQPLVQRHFSWMGIFSADEKTALTGSAGGASTAWIKKQSEELAAFTLSDPADAAAGLDQKTYLPDDLLFKTDRLSMQHSLELRVPLLDHPLAEFAGTIPSLLKIQGSSTKILFRKLLEERIPGSIARHPKKGFGAPVAAWLRGPLKEWSADTLETALHSNKYGWNKTYVRTLLKEHAQGRRNHARRIWALLALEQWQS